MPTPIRGAEALGHVRLEMGDRLELRTPGVLAYAWIRHFPMFKWDAEGQRWDATHNPFSAPVWEEEDRLESDPGSIRAQQYDLVLNGWEAGGGSIRIHRRDLLERAFALMGHSMESARDQFGALLDALEYGAPPHGGIAIGLDRWAALYAEVDNIREVMAFPKTQSGTDLMLDAPSPIAEAQLDELGASHRSSATRDPDPQSGHELIRRALAASHSPGTEKPAHLASRVTQPASDTTKERALRAARAGSFASYAICE